MKGMLFLALMLIGMVVQASRIDAIVQLQPQQQKQVVAIASEGIGYLAMPFAESRFEGKPGIRSLMNESVVKIELVYTAYRKSTTFNQQQLNRQRLLRLKETVPDWFTNDAIEWGLVEQTGCDSPEQGRATYFHGFRITYKPPASETSIQAELDYLDLAASEIDEFMPAAAMSGSSSSSSGNPSSAADPTKRTDSITTGYKLVRTFDDVWGFTHDTIWTKEAAKDAWRNVRSTDSLVMSILMRNQQWNDILVVVDATNSMSPYNAQVLQWVRADQQTGRTKHYTLFNDGDGKKDSNKTPGKTGGIYHQQNSDMDQLLVLMKKAISKCKRNDQPENDIEAVLEGMKACIDCKEVVLICDNDSHMRDFNMLGLIGKPLHIIPCGVRSGIKYDYLVLARETGGTIHLVDQDITGLGSMKEGDTITIMNEIYTIEDNKLVNVNW